MRRDVGRGLTNRDIKLRPVRLGPMAEGVPFRPDHLIGRYTKPGRIWCHPRPNFVPSRIRLSGVASCVTQINNVHSQSLNCWWSSGSLRSCQRSCFQPSVPPVTMPKPQPRASNLRQIGTAVAKYQNQNKDRFIDNKYNLGRWLRRNPTPRPTHSIAANPGTTSRPSLRIGAFLFPNSPALAKKHGTTP